MLITLPCSTKTVCHEIQKNDIILLPQLSENSCMCIHNFTGGHNKKHKVSNVGTTALTRLDDDDLWRLFELKNGRPVTSAFRNVHTNSGCCALRCFVGRSQFETNGQTYGRTDGRARRVMRPPVHRVLIGHL